MKNNLNAGIRRPPGLVFPDEILNDGFLKLFGTAQGLKRDPELPADEGGVLFIRVAAAAFGGRMLDVKAVRQEWSDELISHSREMILHNLDYLLSVGKLYEVRTIIFPGRDRENGETVRYVAERIQDRCFYKLIRYRPYGVREKYQKLLGEEETDADYAERYANLARELGAKKAYVV